jgi:uncharacterized protein YkwD
MSRTFQLLSFPTVLILLCAGCPVEPGFGLGPASSSADPGASTGNNGCCAASGGGSATASGGETLDFQDQLAGQFPTCAEAVNGDTLRYDILRLVNLERERAGLAPLTHNQTLEDQATQYACEMIHYDFFAHENPVTGTELRDRASEFGYEYIMIGENLAAGQSSPAQVMNDWMNSEDHRDNILNPDFTELGVGVRTGGRYGTYWVQEFGQPWSW